MLGVPPPNTELPLSSKISPPGGKVKLPSSKTHSLVPTLIPTATLEVIKVLSKDKLPVLILPLAPLLITLPFESKVANPLTPAVKITVLPPLETVIELTVKGTG